MMRVRVPMTVASVALASLFFHPPGILAAERLVRSPLASVDSVKEKSPSATAGLKEGDCLVELNGRKSPPLKEVLASQFDRENIGDFSLVLRRSTGKVEVRIPPGKSGVEFRPDLSEDGARRLGAARATLLRDGGEEEGIRNWEALAADAEKGGFRDAALWLKLELGRALRDRRSWKEAGRLLKGVEAGDSGKGFWGFCAALGLAESLAGSGDLEGAAGEFNEAVRRARESGSELRVAASLAALGKFEFGRGRLPQARAAAEEALAIRERVAPGSLDVAASLHALGIEARERGDLDASQGYHLRAVEIRERVAPGTLELSESLNALGVVALDRGNLAEARELYLRALDIRQRLTPGGLDVAKSLNNLGIVARNQGDLTAAKDFYRRALAILDRLWPDSVGVAKVLNNLGVVAEDQRDLATGRESHLRALAIRERLAPDSLEVAMSFNNLGVVAEDQGDLAAARESHLRALAIRERLAPDSLDVAMSLNNIGNLAVDQGDLAAAREYHLKALAIRERLAPDGMDVAMSLNNLGNSCQNQGDLAGALEFYQRSLAVKQRLAPDGLDAAKSLDNLGRVAREQGDLAAAKDYHLRALAIHERLAPDSLLVATSLTNLAEVAQRQGDLATARALYQKALAIHRRLLPGDLATAMNLQGLAEVEGAAGDTAAQSALLAEAVGAIEAQRAKVGGELAKVSFAAAHQDIYTELIAADLAAGKGELALEALERSRARALLEMVSSRFIDLRGEVPEALLEQRLELAHRRRTLTDNLSEADAKTDPKEVESWRSELLRLPQREDALAEEIRKASPRLAALEDPRPLGFGGIAGALEPGTLLLAYATAEKETYFFALLKRGAGPDLFKARRLPVGKKELEVRVRAFRARLGPDAAAGTDSEAWKKPARDLFEALLGPAMAEIATCDRILLLPDGPLHLLPFGALIPCGKKVPKGMKLAPIGLQRPISIEESVTIYAELGGGKAGGRPPGATRWTGFGDPVYPGAGQDGVSRGTATLLRGPAPQLEPLPGTRREIEAISKLFGDGAKALLGAAATEEAVRSTPKDTPYLHFACHGLIDPAFPMNSALALSAPPPPGPGEAGSIADDRKDGLLRAWEIIQDVKLESDCVVLSACETGTGRIFGGEGVVGLTRAFYYAGAKSVMVSLWPISDASTAQLMTAFYEEILKGSPRDVALQRAQARLAADSKYAHPFYWAAFELHGRAD